MAKNGKAVGLFDGLDDEINREEQSVKSTKKSSTGKTRSSAHVQPVPQTELPVRHAGGRPRSTVERVQFTTKPTTVTRRRIKTFAAEHDLTASDVIDALTERYLDALAIDLGKE